MEAGRELPASLCLSPALFLTGSILPACLSLSAGHHSFQTGESLFLGSLCVLTPPLILHLTLYGLPLFFRRETCFLCTCVCLHAVMSSMPVSGRSGDPFSKNGKKKSLFISLRKLAFYLRSPQGGVLLGRLALFK